MASFVPRSVFHASHDLPRTYFLGHHRAGLDQMKRMLTSVDTVIECRDYRIPATSINPMFEEALGGKQRYVVYTKRDLAGDSQRTKNEQTLRKWNPDAKVFFFTSKLVRTTVAAAPILRSLKQEPPILTGRRVLVVGMPNVGKSTLLNTVRYAGTRRAKAASTGADPGVTRRVGSAVKIIDPRVTAHGQAQGFGFGPDSAPGTVYMYDTPGVFMPYMPDAETMLKLALCNCVRDALIPPVTLADYLLFLINQYDPTKYTAFSLPTNDIHTLLDSVARRTGCLIRGGVPDEDRAARRLVNIWRNGKLGAFMLDDLNKVTPDSNKQMIEERGGSLMQAKKAMKAARKEAQAKIRESNG